MKPHIVQVDATSVTIACYPKYFNVQSSLAEVNYITLTEKESQIAASVQKLFMNTRPRFPM